MTDLQELIERHKPLRERVFDLIKDETTFTIKDVQRLFPNEADKPLYRVLKELETQKRIRFLTYQNRSKLYTAVGSSELPMMVGSDNSTWPCSVFLKGAADFYNEEGFWTRLERANKIPVTVAKLFLVATLEGKELKDGWINLQQTLINQRADLQLVVGYLDSILKHPSMDGDIEKFKAVFNGEDAAIPKPEEITKFRSWFTQIWKGKFNRD